MPNWCNTRIVYYGDKDRIEELYKLYERVWFGEIFEKVGIELPSGCNVRSYIRHYQPPLFYRGGSYLMYADHDDAWYPTFKMYNRIAEHFNINYEVFAIEPGNDVYITTDVEGRFFKHRFLIYADCNSSGIADIIDSVLLIREFIRLDGTWFADFLSIKKYIAENVSKEIACNIGTLDNLINLLKSVIQLSGLDDSVYISVKEVKTVAKEE